MKKQRNDLVMRQRTLSVTSAKGGVNKSSLIAGLGYEAARMGLKVLFVDGDGDGGISSATGTYAPEGNPSITEIIDGSSGLAIYPVTHWHPGDDQPWMKGGPAIPGGEVYILPTHETKSGKSISAELAREGTTEEIRLARVLNDERLQEVIDLVLIDMPATSAPATISALLHATEHIAFPMFPEYYAYEGIVGVDSRIDNWVDATGKNVNYLGGIPTSIPTNLHRSPDELEVLVEAARWIKEASDDHVHVLAPGIERRKSMSRASKAAVPISCLTTTKQQLRDAGTIPPAFTRTLLTILENMRPDPTDPETADRVNFDVEHMKEAVCAQDMPKRWREIIEGPQFIDGAEWAALLPPTDTTISQNGEGN